MEEVLKVSTDQAAGGGNQTSTDNSNIRLNGFTPLSWLTDYPILAYNSYLPDQSQIILTNLADR